MQIKQERFCIIRHRQLPLHHSVRLFSCSFIWCFEFVVANPWSDKKKRRKMERKWGKCKKNEPHLFASFPPYHCLSSPHLTLSNAAIPVPLLFFSLSFLLFTFFFLSSCFSPRSLAVVSTFLLQQKKQKSVNPEFPSTFSAPCPHINAWLCTAATPYSLPASSLFPPSLLPRALALHSSDFWESLLTSPFSIPFLLLLRSLLLCSFLPFLPSSLLSLSFFRIHFAINKLNTLLYVGKRLWLVLLHESGANHLKHLSVFLKDFQFLFLEESTCRHVRVKFRGRTCRRGAWARLHARVRVRAWDGEQCLLLGVRIAPLLCFEQKSVPFSPSRSRLIESKTVLLSFQVFGFLLKWKCINVRSHKRILLTFLYASPFLQFCFQTCS